MKVERHFNEQGRCTSRGLKIVCSSADHFGCSKYRAATMDVKIHGPMSTVYFLGASCLNAHGATNKRAHKAQSREEVAVYTATHG